jgi:hypothetical protein
MVVTATYVDGTTREVTNYTYDQFEKKTGTQKIKIDFLNYLVSVETSVTVAERAAE